MTHWTKLPNRDAILARIVAKKTGLKQSAETVEKRRLKLIGQKRTAETRLRMSRAQKGIPKWSEEQKQKARLRMLGTRHSESTKTKMRASARKESESCHWKGNDVSYIGIHAWVARKLGKPSICEDCGKSDLTGRKIHWANKSKEYKRDINDWIRLCVSCHWKFDMPYLKRERDYMGKFV